MSVSMSAERDRIQRQVEELEQSLSVTRAELELLSSETDESDGADTEEEVGQSAAGLLVQREKIQKEIQNLENVLGPHSPTCLSDDEGSSSSSEESELGLSLSVDSCLQMNLVYQQVVQETLDQLETLLAQNHRQQKEVVSQLSGSIRESPREQRPPSSCQQPVNMFLGRFLKPYFKDKLTGLGPPSNQEAKEKTSRMTGCPDNHKLKIKRWESWQKTLLIHSVSRDHLRRLIQPKLSKVDYLSQKLLSAEQTDRQQLREQIDCLEREIDLLRSKKEEELIGDQYEERDWQRISNVDFEGTRDAEDIRCFWQNFLHPSINKSGWSQEEVQQLKEVSRRHGGRHWEAIAAELGTGRTAFLCLQTFQRFVSDSLRRGSWTPDEDALLRELVDKMRIGNFIPYTQMSYFMEGRDPAQLIYRWNQVLDPSLKKGPWTQQEDQLLLQAVSRHGEKNWWRIRVEVPGRSDSACRDRYYDCLKADTKKGAFDEQEKELLVKLVEKHGVGRWARIALEIPHRFDAQCLREWRKLNRSAAPAQKNKRAENPPARRGAATRRKVSPTKKRMRRQLRSLEEEEEEEEIVEYMDSDEEEKKKKGERTEKLKPFEDKEEEEYSFPPMEEWTPADRAQGFSVLSFRPVEFPPSGDAHSGKHVRSTVLGEFGRSVIIGPPPRELRWEERHCCSTMMMVSPDQLRAHLNHQAQKFNNPTPQGTSGRKHLGRVTNIGLDYELQAAVTPWIGNLLIPAKTKMKAADALREQGEKMGLTSTPVFLLLLQTMRVDAAGCKEMIEHRKKGVVVPPTDPPPVQTKAAQTFARTLQQRRVREELQELDLQHRLIQLTLLQQPPPTPMTPQNPPRMPLQMHPQMSPLAFPQTVLIPIMKPHAASIQFVPPPSVSMHPLAPFRPPPEGGVPSLVPAPPPAPQRLNVPHASVVPVPLNTTRLQEAGPHAPSPTQHFSIGSTPASQNTCPPNPSNPTHPATSPSNSILDPLKGQTGTEDQQAAGSRLNVEGGADTGLGGGCTGEDRAGASATEEGKRIRTLSLKARALQEAAAAQAEAKRKVSPRRKTRKPPGQTAAPVPPQQVCTAPIHLPPPQVTMPPAVPPLRPDVPPVSPATPVYAGHSLSLAPPPSIPTNQHTDSSTSGLPGLFHSDHDYICSNLDSAPKQSQRTHCKSGPAHNSPKAPPRGRKRLRGEEQLSVTSSNGERCVGGSGDAGGRSHDTVGGSGDAVGRTGVTQGGKRVRKPSERARALQEATQAKAEAKKKRTTSSSPHQKRCRTSHTNEQEAVQSLPQAQLPGLFLHPGQSMWVMAAGGLVQLAEAPPSGVQLALMPSSLFPVPPIATPLPTTGGLRPLAPLSPCLNQPRPLHALPIAASRLLRPAITLQPVPNHAPPPLPSCPSKPPPNLFLPYKGTVRSPPPPRKEALQFDPSLMFLEPCATVCDWLSGRGGVVVSGAGVALPYLPPFVSSLSTLSALLQAKKSLTKQSLQVLQGSEPQHPQTKHTPVSGTRGASGQPADLPDSTSDLRPASGKRAPLVSSHFLQEEAEEELVVVVRQLVTERFSCNPAYQLLKTRFLSCFTLPALLATIQPITDKTVSHQEEEEEEQEKDEEQEEVQEQEEEEEVKKERGRSVQTSLLLCDESGVSASHFSGITDTPVTVQ